MTNTTESNIQSAAALWGILGGLVVGLYWLFNVSAKADNGVEIAKRAETKADTALSKSSETDVRIERLYGKLDVTNTKLDSTNKLLEQLVRERNETH